MHRPWNIVGVIVEGRLLGAQPVSPAHLFQYPGHTLTFVALNNLWQFEDCGIILLCSILFSILLKIENKLWQNSRRFIFTAKSAVF